MGEIADINIGFTTQAHKCDMADMGGACENHEQNDGCSFEPVDCCDDDYVQIHLDESFDTPVTVENELNTEFLAAFTVVYLNLYDFQQEAKADFVDYSPPLLRQDIPVLFQSFLI